MLTLVLVAAIISSAAAQEADYAPYVESIQMLLDKDTEQAHVSVLLQSISVNDIMITGPLEQDLREHDRILAMLLTNTDTCVPGVTDEACIILNMLRVPDEKDIITVQQNVRTEGDKFIDELNTTFGTNAEFHSVFVHHDNTQSQTLGMSGAVDRNTVSAVYTIPQQDTTDLFEMLAAKLLAPDIYQGGGFVDAARILAAQDNATVTFAAIPGNTNSLMQLRVLMPYQHAQDTVNPLERIGSVARSAYFDEGFYPLNSLVRVVITSGEGIAVSDVQSPLLPTAITNGRIIPSEISGAGWVFDPASGIIIRGTYLIGAGGQANLEQTAIVLGETVLETPVATPIAEEAENMSWDNIMIVVIIVVTGAAAGVFYLRGYKRS